MKRLGIYFFFDKDGIVDDYVPYFLERLKPFCTELCVVVNGSLNQENHVKIAQFADNVLYRNNEGFDAWAYKYAIEHYGYEDLKSYDELLLCNFTFFGPLYPMDEIFDTMAKRDCDFWGMLRHNAHVHKYAGQRVIEHVQSFFIIFRNSILSSSSFKTYWETLKPIKNYEEAIAFHEMRCSSYFEKLNFKSDTYVSFLKYKKELSFKSYFFHIKKQIIEDRFPFIKRKIFEPNGGVFMWPIAGGQVAFFNFIKEETNYNIKFIEENIKRSYDTTQLGTQTVMPPKRKIIMWFLCAYFFPIKNFRIKCKEKLNTLKPFENCFK